MVNRNMVRFSKNGYAWPYDATALANVAAFGKAERSATMGGCRYSRTTDGLYAKYNRKGAFTTGSITCNSRPVEARHFCVPGAMYTFPLKPACGKLWFKSLTRPGS